VASGEIKSANREIGAPRNGKCDRSDLAQAFTFFIDRLRRGTGSGRGIGGEDTLEVRDFVFGGGEG
jgi:hypothetical protein